MTTALLCWGNHAQDISVIWYRVHGKPITAYDDDPLYGNPPSDDLDCKILIGVNDSQIRRQLAQRFERCKGARPLIDPEALIGPDCHFGKGSVVSPAAVLTHSVSLGKHCHVNTSVSLVRAVVGDYSTLSPGATVCGNVTIGEACQIGAGSVICERVTIGNDVVIAAGAIIPPHSVVPDGTKVIGVFRPDVPL